MAGGVRSKLQLDISQVQQQLQKLESDFSKLGKGVRTDMVSKVGDQIEDVTRKVEELAEKMNNLGPKGSNPALKEYVD